MKRYVLIKMGGKGTRFGSEIPKQFCEVEKDKPLFTYVLEQYKKADFIDGFIIVTNEDWIEYTKQIASPILGDRLIEIVQGGNSNAASAKAGVECARKYLDDNDILVMHDVTNPIVDLDGVKKVIEAAEKYSFASAYTEQVQAIYQKDENDFVSSSLQKSEIASGYSPEAFNFTAIYNCYANATEDELSNAFSSPAIAAKHGQKTKLIKINALSLKITYAEDLEIFKYLYKYFLQ